MKVTGQCHCGAIRYEAEIDPARVQACHCTDCQRLSGAAYRATVGASKETFRLLEGTPKETSASSARRVPTAAAVPAAKGACPATGTWAECSVVERLDRAGLAPRLDSSAVTEARWPLVACYCISARRSSSSTSMPTPKRVSRRSRDSTERSTSTMRRRSRCVRSRR